MLLQPQKKLFLGKQRTLLWRGKGHYCVWGGAKDTTAGGNVKCEDNTVTRFLHAVFFIGDLVVFFF